MPRQALPRDRAVLLDLDAADKAYLTLRARLALAGYTLVRSDAQDGPQTFYASRWGLIRELRDFAAIDDFCRQVGAPA